MKHTILVNAAPLTKENRGHWLNGAAQYLSDAFAAKFMRGEVQHGSDLGSVSIDGVLAEMEHESLDQLAYTLELRRRIAAGLVAVDISNLRTAIGVITRHININKLSSEQVDAIHKLESTINHI